MTFAQLAPPLFALLIAGAGIVFAIVRSKQLDNASKKRREYEQFVEPDLFSDQATHGDNIALLTHPGGVLARHGASLGLTAIIEPQGKTETSHD